MWAGGRVDMMRVLLLKVFAVFAVVVVSLSPSILLLPRQTWDAVVHFSTRAWPHSSFLPGEERERERERMEFLLTFAAFR